MAGHQVFASSSLSDNAKLPWERLVPGYTGPSRVHEFHSLPTRHYIPHVGALHSHSGSRGGSSSEENRYPGRASGGRSRDRSHLDVTSFCPGWGWPNTPATPLGGRDLKWLRVGGPGIHILCDLSCQPCYLRGFNQLPCALVSLCVKCG